jgi:large subunit ribosomal protein L15
MNLSTLRPNEGAKHRRKRLGCGESSGRGKTSGRGGKGQSARSGSSIRVGFEGGQMPLIRRIPKRGFNNSRFATRHFAVNLKSLDESFIDGETVDLEALKLKGVVGGSVKSIKILSGGGLTRKLTVIASAFSGKAKAAIEALGGQTSVV